MHHFRTTRHQKEFTVLHASRSAQAAMMILRPGAKTGERPENEHPWAEQWLYIVSGSGRATVAGRRLKVRAGDLILIEKGEPHQIINTGRKNLVTFNVYAPPAYHPDGGLLKKRR